MPYSLKQAADATDKSKPTILRAIQTGKISAQKDEHGEWQIDPAELHRVYEPVHDNGTDEPELNDTQSPFPAYETGLLRGEVEQLRERLSALENQMDWRNWRRRFGDYCGQQRPPGPELQSKTRFLGGHIGGFAFGALSA